MKNVAEEGGVALFVGTKNKPRSNQRRSNPFRSILRKPSLVRWNIDELGNYPKRVARLKQINKMEEDGTFDVLPKKEVVGLNKERERLEKFLGGIADMPRIPDVMYVVDPRKERIAIQEARKLNIPIVAMVDTNCDPDEIDVVIPSNDDAIRAVKLITAKMADAFIEGNQGEDQVVEEDFSAESTENATSIEEIVDVVEGDNVSAE